MQQLKHVRINTRKTTFWRYQSRGDDCLATVEAMYYFFRDWHNALHKEYDGRYDNLLWLYAFVYDLIQDKYRTSSGLTFKHKDNYIKYT
mmetsp:Transcript_22397/g.37014  ORF Transcript_22397/g.37014 Transcript_22397/m.37014 type:complete len:89 (+) Transcript_22397:2265-2531(+)